MLNQIVTFPSVHLDKMKAAARDFDPRNLPRDLQWAFDTAHGGTLDAAESAFVARQLEHMRTGILEVQYPELKGSLLVPIDTQCDTGAEQFTWTFFDYVGEARVVANLNTEAPLVEVKAQQATVQIKSVIDAYAYSIQEARNAMFARVPLIPRKAVACREVIERKLDDIWFLGDTFGGLKGLLTLSSTVTFTPATKLAGGTAWETATPDEIIADLHGIANKIVTDSKGIEVPDTILLPLSSYTLISSRRMGDGSDTTILSHFLASSPFIRNVDSTHKSEAAPASEWTGKRMVCYRRDPQKLAGILPQPFEQLAPQAVAYSLKTHCHARTAGVVAYYPKSIAYGDGI